MNKKLLTLSLVMAVPFFASCGGKKNPDPEPPEPTPVDDKINSQEELERAVHFQDKDGNYFEYVQDSCAKYGANYLTDEYSPTVFHYIESIPSPTEPEYEERVFTYENEQLYRYERDNPTSDWTKTLETYKDNFVKVSDLFEKHLFDDMMTYIDYDNLEYSDDHYESIIEKEDNEILGKIILKFADKKLTYYQSSYYNAGEFIEKNAATFTYEEITPDVPIVPDSKIE